MPVSVLFVFGVLLYLQQDCTLYNNDICVSFLVCVYPYFYVPWRVSVLFVFRVLLYLEQDCTLYNKDIYPI